MGLNATRAAVAAAASSVPGVSVAAEPGNRNPGIGQGWVALSSAVPSTFRTTAATFVVIVSLGSEVTKAEGLLETLAIPVMDAVTNALPCAGVRLEPVSLSTEQGGTLHGFTLTLTTEV